MCSRKLRVFGPRCGAPKLRSFLTTFSGKRVVRSRSALLCVSVAAVSPEGSSLCLRPSFGLDQLRQVSSVERCGTRLTQVEFFPPVAHVVARERDVSGVCTCRTEVVVPDCFCPSKYGGQKLQFFRKCQFLQSLNGVRPSRESVHGWCGERRCFPVDLVKSTGLGPELFPTW